MAASWRGMADDERARGPAWGRGDAVLFALAVTTLAMIVAQFALAGFGAFAMDKTPTDNAYGAHAVLGLVIGAMTLFILAAVLVSPPARAHRRTLWLAVTLALLAVVLQPVLGGAGTKVPVLGALHGLNAAVISAVTGMLTAGTARRRAAAGRRGERAATGSRAKAGLR